MTDKTEGRLAELNVKPGDVVENLVKTSLWGGVKTITPEGWIQDDEGDFWGPGRDDYPDYPSWQSWRIVSRASSAPSEPVLWRDMTDDQRVDSLLAKLKGAPNDVTGRDRLKQALAELGAIKPEPKRETVALWIDCPDSVGRKRIGTIDLIDGKPDLASIKMEALE